MIEKFESVYELPGKIKKSAGIYRLDELIDEVSGKKEIFYDSERNTAYFYFSIKIDKIGRNSNIERLAGYFNRIEIKRVLKALYGEGEKFIDFAINGEKPIVIGDREIAGCFRQDDGKFIDNKSRQAVALYKLDEEKKLEFRLVVAHLPLNCQKDS